MCQWGGLLLCWILVIWRGAQARFQFVVLCQLSAKFKIKLPDDVISICARWTGLCHVYESRNWRLYFWCYFNTKTEARNSVFKQLFHFIYKTSYNWKAEMATTLRSIICLIDMLFFFISCTYRASPQVSECMRRDHLTNDSTGAVLYLLFLTCDALV